jgi:ubiquinone biosynthesis protein COQ9
VAATPSRRSSSGAGEGERRSARISNNIFEWVPQIGVQERSLYRGDEEGFLAHKEKKGAIWDLLEKVS